MRCLPLILRGATAMAAAASSLASATTVALALAASPAVTPLVAQQPRAARPLPPHSAELEEAWSGPLQLVELKNGDLVVHDGREKRLVVASFRTQEVREAAREGSGPTEYRSAMGLWRIPGDSVQVMDFMQQRMLILDPTGRARRTTPLPGAGDAAVMMRRPVTRELDARGRWYGEGRDIRFENGKLSFGDSVIIVRWDPKTGRADSLVKMQNVVRAPEFGAGGTSVRMRVPGYPRQDVWGVFPDGRVIVLRGEGYVPELIAADGRARRMAALPYPRLPVTAADKRAMIDSVRRAIEEGMRQAAGMIPANTPLPKFDLQEPEPWQAEKPPFAGDRVRIDPRQRAWVPVVDRTPGLRYDLLDAEGRVVDAIKLPPRVQLLGFGAQSLYTARRDEDDLLYIRRHPLP